MQEYFYDLPEIGPMYLGVVRMFTYMVFGSSVKILNSYHATFIFFQLPRLYNIYKEMGIVTSFQNILDNIFIPLFEVTINPDSHPQLHVFLKQVCHLVCQKFNLSCSVFSPPSLGE